MALRKAGMALLNHRLMPVFLLGLAVVASTVFLTHETSDHVRFLNRWMSEVRAQGWRSMAGGFANYTPPYIYLMNTVSGFTPVIGTPAALKLVNIPFLTMAMIAAYGITAVLYPDLGRARLAGAMMWALPTVLVNSFVWGQCDIIYTSLVLCCVFCLVTDRPWFVAALFGIALSFKLQAIFIGPVLFYAFLTGRLGIRHALLVPAVYMAMMFPAWLAGRPIEDLVMIYAGQADFYNRLAMNAPNPWYVADALGLDYRLGIAVGLALAALAGLGLSLWAFTRRMGKSEILLLATASATWMPYLLPKMHDRYMFLADVLTVLLAFAKPRLWWVAVLAQAGSLAAYGGYFGAHRFLGGFDTPWIGVAAYTLVAAALLVEVGSLPAAERPGLKIRI